MTNENGVPAPNYTQTPNALFALLPSMHEAELKITLAIVRKTFGWHKERDMLSLTQLEELTGLSRQGVIDGIEKGIERGTIERIPHGQSFDYSIVVNAVDQQELVKTVDQQPVKAVDQQPVKAVDTQKKEVLNKELKKKRERKPRAPASGPDKEKVNYFPIASALSSVCQMPFDPNKGRLFKESKELCRADAPPVTPEEITARYGAGGWWYSGDWRGQKGELPTLGAIRQTWGQWLKPKIIPIARGKKTKGEIIRELMNGDGADDQFGLGAIFGGVSSATGGNGHTETIAGRVVDGTCRYT